MSNGLSLDVKKVYLESWYYSSCWQFCEVRLMKPNVHTFSKGILSTSLCLLCSLILWSLFYWTILFSQCLTNAICFVLVNFCFLLSFFKKNIQHRFWCMIYAKMKMMLSFL
ncbi:hypothetical protein HS088_TW10G00319 [Tripterygium wilfordii]|uniref:Uncharacterized protein n=1 Tax=Tripterygium wilfordii TaxID=458696 RepID=A0A7J7D4S7_TRIWF|nr:hypothetical protein HS088_TW10G00319 [Tripterygium wilfordii]